MARGNHESAGFNAVGDDLVLGAVEALDALNFDGGTARALDVCAHGDQEVGEVGHLGLAGGVADDGFSFSKNGGHEHIFGAGDGDAIEVDARSSESVGGTRFDITVGLFDFRAKLLERGHMHVDGPGSDGTAAGHGDTSTASARDQGTEYQARGAHRFYHFVGSFGAVEGSRFDTDLALACSTRRRRGEQTLHSGDVFDPRDAAQNDGFFGQQRSG